MRCRFHVRRASSLIALGLSSKPSPFPSREATLPPCSSSRSTLPLVASANDRAVSAASGCAYGCPRLQVGAVPRRTPERPNAIIPFGCPPTTASSEPPPPSSAASSHELPHHRLHELLTEVEPLTNHSGTAAQPPVPSPLVGSPLPKHAAVGSHCLVSPPSRCASNRSPTSSSSPSRHPDPTRRRQAAGFGRLYRCAPGSPLLRARAASPSRPGLKTNLAGPCNLGQAKAISRVAHVHSTSS
jgi:hypothetical protein